MTTVDLVILGVTGISGIVAFMRGLVREILSIGSWAGASALAAWLEPVAKPAMLQWIPSPEWVDPISYIVLFLVALIVLTILARAVSGAVRSSAVGGVDRSLGLLFGIARGFGIAIIAYIVAGMAVPVEHWPDDVLNSRAIPFVYEGATWAVAAIPETYRPFLVAPPGPRQAGVGPILNNAPAGRAIDPPPRR